MSVMDEPDFAPKFAKSNVKRTGHPTSCPACAADLTGDEIPHGSLFEVEATHFSRVIWVSSMKRDAGVAYKCPDCEHEWAIPGREAWFAEHKSGE